MGRVREKKTIEERKSQKKQNTGARNARKVARRYFFPMICGSGGSESRAAKVASGVPSGQMRNENYPRCGAKHVSKSKRTNTPGSGHSWAIRCQKKIQVKMNKTQGFRATFESLDMDRQIDRKERKGKERREKE